MLDPRRHSLHASVVEHSVAFISFASVTEILASVTEVFASVTASATGSEASTKECPLDPQDT